jgi:hypothetical protein
MARSPECTDQCAQNQLTEPTLSETLIDIVWGESRLFASRLTQKP